MLILCFFKFLNAIYGTLKSYTILSNRIKHPSHVLSQNFILLTRKKYTLHKNFTCQVEHPPFQTAVLSGALLFETLSVTIRGEKFFHLSGDGRDRTKIEHFITVSTQIIPFLHRSRAQAGPKSWTSPNATRRV